MFNYGGINDMKNRYKVSVVTGIVLMLATMSLAGILVYYGQIRGTTTVNNLLYLDGQVLEDYTLDEVINGYAGESNFTSHSLNANKNVNVTFHVEDCEEVNVSVRVGGYVIEELQMLAGLDYYFDVYYEINDLAAAGVYYSNVTIDI